MRFLQERQISKSAAASWKEEAGIEELAVVAGGFNSKIRGILTGVSLFVVIVFSANEGIIEHMKEKKWIAAQVGTEYVEQKV